MEALLRREVGHGATAAKLLAGGEGWANNWKGRAQTITLLRGRVQDLQEQNAIAAAAAIANKPAEGAAAAEGVGIGAEAGLECSTADEAVASGTAVTSSSQPAAPPKAAAARNRHDTAHRAYLSALRGGAQVQSVIMFRGQQKKSKRAFCKSLTCASLEHVCDDLQQVHDGICGSPETHTTAFLASKI